MAEGSGLRVNSDKWEGAATAQKLCYGYAAATSRYARRDLRCAFTELLRGVDVCLILDQFGELITCPIQEGDGAKMGTMRSQRSIRMLAARFMEGLQ
jgi:hypothetical protein